MSRGFIKEDDQEEIPMIPPRAYLPVGVPNFVTPGGLEALLQEREFLNNEISTIDITTEKERRIAINHIQARLSLLEERIASAKVVTPKPGDNKVVKFGNTITIKLHPTGKVEKVTIVGADEADIQTGKISFFSPLAKALINKKKGDKAILKVPAGEKTFEILEIEV